MSQLFCSTYAYSLPGPSLHKDFPEQVTERCHSTCGGSSSGVRRSCLYVAGRILTLNTKEAGYQTAKWIHILKCFDFCVLCFLKYLTESTRSLYNGLNAYLSFDKEGSLWVIHLLSRRQYYNYCAAVVIMCKGGMMICPSYWARAKGREIETI